MNKLLYEAFEQHTLVENFNLHYFSHLLYPIFEWYDVFSQSKLALFFDSFLIDYNYNNLLLGQLQIYSNEFFNLNQVVDTNIIINVVDQLSNDLCYYCNIDLNLITTTIFSLNFNIFLFVYNITYFFVLFLIFLVIFKYFYETTLVKNTKRNNFFYFYEKFLIVWVNFISIKFESYEEALTSFILWPWAIFLVFTHFTGIEDHESFFIFIEWGLPVVYGYFLILEHIWNFGKHMLLYLNGTRGRSVLIVTLFEDFIAFSIIFARITLQAVRGLICGFFHDFFRELSDYLLNIWELYWNYIDSDLPFCSDYYVFDSILFFSDWYILVFILLFIYVILFLQLLFLVIAVWLFCKCWFISHKNFYNLKSTN